MWIIVEDGDVFEGNELHWADCFFTNVSVDNVKDFCDREGWKVEFKDEAPMSEGQLRDFYADRILRAGYRNEAL